MRFFKAGICSALAAGVLAIALGGCEGSFCVGDGCTISGDEVAKEAQTQLSAVVAKDGLPELPPVDCPDIDNEVGASVHCTSTGEFNGKTRTLGIEAKVKSIDEDSETTNFTFNTTGFEN